MLSWTRRKLYQALMWSMGLSGQADAPERHTQPYGPRGDKSWAADVVAGPLTSFGTDGRQHACAAVCEPSSPAHRACFTQMPYTPVKDRDASC